MPGIVSYEAVCANHLRVFAKELGGGLNPDCRLGNLEGNPMHEDMVDACGLLRPAFLFNVVLDGNNRYYKRWQATGSRRSAKEPGIVKRRVWFLSDGKRILP